MKNALLPFVFMAFCLVWNSAEAQWTSLGSGINIPQRTLAGIAQVNENILWGFTWHASQVVPIHEFTRTTDGGQTWHAGAMAGVDPDQFVFCLFPLDSQTAWLATADEKKPIKGKIYKTTDGGTTWVHQATGFTGFNETPAGVYFWNENEGVAYGATAEAFYNDQIAVYTTADGGENWTKVVAPNMPAQLPGEGIALYNFAGFFSVAGNTFWFGTTKKRVFRSTDRGKTWQVFDTPQTNSNYISSIGFRDGQTGLAVGNNPLTLARSTDGGQTWEKLPLSVPSNFRGIQIEYVPGTNSTWYLMTSPTKYMISYNDGNSWETFDSNIEPRSLEFLDAKTGFAGSYITSLTNGGAYRWTGAPLGNRWFVNDDATGVNNGSNWADAFTDLQSALAAATDGDQIWVAEGTYKPDTSGGSPTATFLIDKNIRLYGGFAGTETALAQRGNPADHPTVLSGDLNGNDLPNDLQANRLDNSAHVMRIYAPVGISTLLDGFTFKGGHADGSGGLSDGGGLYCLGAPVIRNCIFEQNYAKGKGGGLAFYGVGTNGARVEYCRFEKNRAESTFDSGGGLSTRLADGAGITVDHCSFLDNTVASRGGGIGCFGSNLTVTHTQFSGNINDEQGGGLWFWPNNSSRTLVVDSCTFENNSSSFGGGLYAALPNSGSVAVTNSVFDGNIVTPNTKGWGQE